MKADEYDNNEDGETSYSSYSRSLGSGQGGSRSGSESSSSSDHDETGSSFELGTDSGSDDDGAGRTTSNDKRKMGKEGEAYTKADLRMVANHVATTLDWDDLNHREKWEPFAEQVRLPF